MTRTRLANGGGYRPTSGSAEHPHLSSLQRKPWLKATLRHFSKLLRQRDKETLAFARECESVLSLLYCRPQRIRTGTPLERAHGIVSNVYKQQSVHATGVFKQYSKMPVGMVIVLHALAAEVAIRHSGLKPTDRPRWRWVQIARPVFHLLKADFKEYSTDDGHGRVGVMRVRTKYQLQSHWVARRIAESMERLYRVDFHAHHSAITTRVYQQAARKLLNC